MQFLRTNKNLVPILLLASFSICTILIGLFTSFYIVTFAHYGAFVAILLNLLAYWFYRQAFKPLLFLILVLALLNVINFLPASVYIGIGLDDFKLGVSPLGLGLILLYYYLNKPAAHAFINQHLIPTPTPEQAVRRRRQRIDQFKQNFARKSDESLHVMLQEKKVLPDALTAARELLQERQSSTDRIKN